MVSFSEADELRGAEFVGTDLTGARFRDVNLSGVRIRGGELAGAEIDGDIEGMRLNGVEISDLVEAELDRRYPERTVLRARDANSMRAGWAGLEAMWAATMERVSAMPASPIDVSVDGEWTFAQTLRHTVFAIDAWLGGSILGLEHPHHPIGVPFRELRDQAPSLGVDLDRTPAYREVLNVRAERVAMVRDFLATLSDERLGEPRPTPPFVEEPYFPLRQCLWVIFNEEWHHHRYAVRDLDAQTAR
jgi:hypothetical protein